MHYFGTITSCDSVPHKREGGQDKQGVKIPLDLEFRNVLLITLPGFRNVLLWNPWNRSKNTFKSKNCVATSFFHYNSCCLLSHTIFVSILNFTYFIYVKQQRRLSKVCLVFFGPLHFWKCCEAPDCDHHHRTCNFLCINRI